MDLDELESGLADLTATYNGHTATFQYHPALVGMNFQRALAESTAPPFNVGPVADQLAVVLSTWDLRRKGQPIPITPEAIGSVGMGVSAAIARAIMEDFANPKSPVAAPPPVSPSSTPSPATSEPAADSVIAQDSPLPSSMPAGPDLTPGISTTSPAPASA